MRPGAPGSASENNARGKREMNDKFASKRERKIRGVWGREGKRRRRNPRYRMLIRAYCSLQVLFAWML